SVSWPVATTAPRRLRHDRTPRRCSLSCRASSSVTFGSCLNGGVISSEIARSDEESSRLRKAWQSSSSLQQLRSLYLRSHGGSLDIGRSGGAALGTLGRCA